MRPRGALVGSHSLHCCLVRTLGGTDVWLASIVLILRMEIMYRLCTIIVLLWLHCED